MKWEGKYYFDKVLPFGLRSAPSIFNQLSDTIKCILAYELAISYVDKIFYDFLIMQPMSLEPPYDRAASIRLKAASGETFGPSQILEFLGIELDSNLMEACLPQTRLRKSDKS